MEGLHGHPGIMHVGFPVPGAVLPEKTGSCNPRRSQAMLRRFWRFWQTPGHKQWLVLLLIYPVGIALTYAILTPMLVDFGWSMERIGMVMNILGSVISVLAALFTGWLLCHRTRFSVFTGISIAYMLCLLTMALPLTGPSDNWRIYCAVGVCFLVHGFLSTLMSTMMMDRVSLKSPATDFTLQYSVFFLVWTP